MRDDRVREYILPKRILKCVQCESAEVLLEDNFPEVSLKEDRCCTMTTDETTACLLLDFGEEFHGGVSISSVLINGGNATANIRLCFGESANEALSHVGEKGATNDHSPRDVNVLITSLSTAEFGNTGYRFLCIELLSKCTLTLKTIQGVKLFKPYEYVGSFVSSDETLNKIYDTCAHTVHMCMQTDIWDGIKRDRLLWIGDLAPELKAIKYLFGDVPDIYRGLDIASDFIKSGSWVDGIATYSLWWLINLNEWYEFTGKREYLENQKENIIKLIKQVLSNTDENGVFYSKSSLDNFVDWPTNQTEAAKSGTRALTAMFFESAVKISKILKLDEEKKQCDAMLKKLRKLTLDPGDFKQIAALLLLEDMGEDKCKTLLSNGGAKGFSTFMSYYILSAMAKCTSEKEVIDALKEYYGGMLKLGATTFWEDFDIEWMKNACRIDEICDGTKSDIHGDNGRFCYIGYRHSLCHGWSSGPLAFLSEYVLGVNMKDSRTVEIKPHLETLEYVSGSVATAKGKLFISHKKDENGKIITEVKAPKGIKVICI